MKIETHVTGHGPVPGRRDLAQCKVVATFDGPVETVIVTVIVPNQGEAVATEGRAIARAKELARLFVEQASA